MEHAGKTTIDAIAIVPIIGALKYSDETSALIKGTAKGASKTVYKIGENLHDGMKIGTDDALDAAEEFLGTGYKDMGGGRFLSSDGARGNFYVCK